MNKIINNKGVTLMSLVITVFVLIIIAGITLRMGFTEGDIQEAIETRNEIEKFEDNSESAQQGIYEIISGSEED